MWLYARKTAFGANVRWARIWFYSALISYGVTSMPSQCFGQSSTSETPQQSTRNRDIRSDKVKWPTKTTGCCSASETPRSQLSPCPQWNRANWGPTLLDIVCTKRILAWSSWCWETLYSEELLSWFPPLISLFRWEAEPLASKKAILPLAQQSSKCLFLFEEIVLKRKLLLWSQRSEEITLQRTAKGETYGRESTQR